MPTASSLPLKDFSPKSWRCGHCSRLRSVARHHDWSWWYPSGNRPLQQYLGLHRRALVMVSSSTRLTAWRKIQRSGRNGQRDWCMSRVTGSDYLRSGYLHFIVCLSHGPLIITVITPLMPKPSATKCQRTGWRTRQLPTCRCVSVDVAMPGCKIHEGVSRC